jgi:transposase-like protein
VSKARLIITAVVLEGRTQADVARDYDVSPSWVSKLVARYRTDGDRAFEPRSRRPHTNPNKTPQATVDLIVAIRAELTAAGLDAGSVTLRHNSRLHHIGIGKHHSGTYVVLLVDDLHIRIINAATGEVLRDLTLDTTRDYQPTGKPPGPPPKTKRPGPA